MFPQDDAALVNSDYLYISHDARRTNHDRIVITIRVQQPVVCQVGW